ncbi:hypothetical protein CRG98_029709 [Punica granatum]|uniref:Uncharacterized protein n=1 Tax=Punica granatum TaxID=22663 RepID=A0A2I0J0X8_PUNGR|nr:hypothetical protein CRG98_029709 [Punica granatum]
MTEEDRVDIAEEVNPPVPAHSQPPSMHAPPPLTPASVPLAYSGAPSTHLPPPTSLGAPLPRVPPASSTSDDHARIVALEGTVNQLAASMTTNMAKLFALLRGPNRASSRSTPPSGQGLTVDSTSWIPPTQVPKNTDAPAPPTTHTSTIHPFTSPFPPPPAPMAVPLPLAALLSSNQVLSAPPPVSMPAPAVVYTVPPPMVFLASSVPAPAHLQAPELPPYPSLQPHEYATKWRAQAAKHIPPISEVQQILLFHSTLRGVYYSHLLAHTSFSDLIEAEKKLDLGIKLGKMEGPTVKGEESAKRTSAMPTFSSGRRGKEISINAVNPAHPTSQQYSINYVPLPSVVPAYTSPVPQHRPQPPSPVVHHYASTPPQAPQYRPSSLGTPQSAQQVPPPQGQLGGAVQSRPRRQYPSLPVPLSHIYQQLRASNKIGTIAPGPNFDPTIQDRSKQCEYHRGALGHTLNNCWKLRERIQEMIDAKELTFNAVRSPNVQANPLPNHGPAQGPSINMISICALEEGESEQSGPSPFVIEYVPTEATVGFPGIGTSPTPFVIDIPALEPYSNDKVPWTYEGDVGNLERQFSVMGVTRSGRLYENPAAEDKGKAPAVEIEAIPRAPPTPPKKETVSSIFSNTISFSDDELPSKGCAHSRALHIVCKCNNYVIGRDMIDNGSALNVCLVTTLKQMNVDLNCVRPSKTAVRAFDGSRMEVNGEIDLLIDVGPCSFSVTFQVLDIPNAFSLLLGRPWIHSAGAVPSFLHQKLKFIVEERLITVNEGETYHASALGHANKGSITPIEVEEYKNRRGLGFRLSYHEIMEALRGNHLHRLAEHYGRLNRGIQVPLLSHFFPGPPHIIESTLDGPSSDSDDAPAAPQAVYAITEEIPSGVHIFLAQENEELDNWTSVPRYSAVIADVLHSNPNLRHVDSNPLEECLGEPEPIYFGEGLDENSQVPEIEESLRRLEDRQLTSVEPTEEINVGTEDEPRTLKIGTGLDPTQRARMIDFLTRYQEVFAWSYADMSG